MRKLFILLLSVSGIGATAQTLLRPNIYFRHMDYYNVAAGIQDTSTQYLLSLYGKYKFSDNNVWRKPINFYANHIGCIDAISSFYSASYLYDSYSFYDRHTVYLGYAYQLKLPKTHRLSFGLRGVFNFDHIRWDELPQVKRTGSTLYFTPDIDLGIQYQVKGFRLGVAAKNLIGTRKRVDGELLLQNRRTFYSNISYTFVIKKKVEIAPTVLLYMDQKFGADLGLYLSLFDRVNTSYMFRITELRHIYTLGVRLYKGLYIGLAADHSMIYKDVNVDGMIGYRFPKKGMKR